MSSHDANMTKGERIRRCGELSGQVQMIYALRTGPVKGVCCKAATLCPWELPKRVRHLSQDQSPVSLKGSLGEADDGGHILEGAQPKAVGVGGLTNHHTLGGNATGKMPSTVSRPGQ